jgi:large subunit ribosomal protein L21e
MPHKGHHGKTGIVFNVTKTSVGVEVNKQVRNRIVKKRLNVKIEHIRESKCRTDFLNRVKRVEDVKREAKKVGKVVPIELIKRFPVTPKAGYVVKAESAHGMPRLLAPAPFDEML